MIAYIKARSFTSDLIQVVPLARPKITIGNFEKEVLTVAGIVLVEFQRDWFGACQLINLMLEKLVPVYAEHVKFFCMNCDLSDPIAEKFYVQELPTILFFRDGVVIDRITGMVSTKDLEERIGILLKSDMD
jgi:thioredoxin 1